MQGMGYCRALFDAAAGINSTLDVTDVLQAIARRAAQAMEAKGCTLMLLTPDKRELRPSASFGLSERYLNKGPLSADESIPKALQGRPVTVLDATTDPRVQYGAHAAQEGIFSMLSVPVTLRGEVIGVMRIYTSEPREFTHEDIEFVQAIASLGAIALENARRYTAARTDLASLEAYVYRYPGN